MNALHVSRFTMPMFALLVCCSNYADEAQVARIKVSRPLVYREIAGEKLKFNLALPETASAATPLIICIHGGGWTLGNRQVLLPMIQYFAEHGYAAATIDYRLSPRHRFPAHVEDVKAAVRFFRANARRWQIDPDRIGSIGFSAGGHLSLMVALMDSGDGLQGVGEHLDQPSKVNAAVNFFGSVDFRTWRVSEQAQVKIRKSYQGKGFEQVLAGVFGDYDPQAPIMAIASPITYADADDPPVLSFHGRGDVQVPYSQAVDFDRKMKTIGAPHALITVEKAGHGWGGEKWTRSLAQSVQFFDDHLKEAPPRNTDDAP